jgi:hypothetical protein
LSTRIQIKRGTTEPTGLTTGEFAYNTTNSRLYIGNTASQKWIGGEVTGGVDMGAGSAASQNRVPTQNAVYEYARRNFAYSVNGITGPVGITSGSANLTITRSGNTLTISATDAIGVTAGDAVVWTQLQRFTAGISAHGATLSGTVTAPTQAIGTNNTTVATTAFVQNEIIADTVTSFNGKTGAVTGASLGANTFSGLQTSASGFSGPVTGNASTATKLATARGFSLSGDVNASAVNFDGSANVTLVTSIAAGAIVDADINSAAAIADTKLATISTSGKVSNSATTATSANTVNAIVARDGSGNFGANIISANNIRTPEISHATGVTFVKIIPTTTPGSGALGFQNIPDVTPYTAILTATSTTSDSIIVLPGESGTLALTKNVVTSFNGRTGAVTGASLGANTFNGLQTSASGFSGPLTGNVTGTATNATQLGGTAAGSWALLASPTFTGTPAAPTATAGTNTTQIATTAFVRTEISNLVGAAPTTLDTLSELADALGDDPNFATTITTALGNKAGTTGGGASGTWGISISGNAATATSAGSATTASNSSSLGGTAAASWALLASPTFTGTPNAPTAAVGTNTTQIATTAFVQNEIIADTVTSFNGRTGAVQGVSAAVAGNGISVSGSTGAVTITNTGVTLAVAGTGISVSSGTGRVVITNTGASLGTNTFSGLQTSSAGFSGPLTGNASTATTLANSRNFSLTGDITASAVSFNGGANVQLSTAIAAGAIVNADINNAAAIAVTKLAANKISGVTLGNNLNTLTIGSGLGGGSYNGSSAVTITNNGVTSFNGSTGAIQGVRSVNGYTGGITLSAGLGIDFSQTASGITISNNWGTIDDAAIDTNKVIAYNGTAQSHYYTTVSDLIGNYVTSFNGRTGAVQGVSAAVAGNGISVSGATGAVTITNTGVTLAVAGTGISVSSGTGRVVITNTGASLGTNTFTGLQTSASGFSGPLTGNVTGNASTATTLANSRDFSLTGDITASAVSFNGSGNVQLSTAIAAGAIVNADINNAAAIAVTKLAANKISGVTLGNNLNTLTIGSGLGGGSYNGSGAVTITNNGVTSFNGSTGAIQGVGSVVAGSNISISPTGGTGAVTINATVPTVNNGTLTLNTSGNGITGTQTFTANQSGNATFTVTSNATNANTASTIVFRDTNGNFSAGTITAALTGTATNASSLGGTAAGSWALLASPTFTGTPAAPTPTAGTNTTQIATTAFVRTEISNLVGAAPTTLDTLSELADALGDDPNFATTITTSLGNKAGTTGGGASGTWGISISGNAATATSAGSATSASTLSTARNINGTAFNGSAGITTAYWGNARTITIGQTGKSVDGGGNVSWTLAEIGGVTSSSAYTWSAAQTFNAGVTASTLDVTGAARFNGSVNLGNETADVITIVGGATFGRTVNVTEATRLNGGLTASTLDVTGTSRFANLISASAVNTATIRGNGTLPLIVDPAAGSILSEGSLRFSSGLLPTRYSTLTTASLSADRTITLPNEDGTVALRGANTFTGLQTLTAGLSAAGGITLNGAVTGATATFSRLLTANAGISASGITLAGNAQINFSGGDGLIDATSYLRLGENSLRVYIGAAGGGGNQTGIFLRDAASALDITNPFGTINIGDPASQNSGVYIAVSNDAGQIDVYGDIYQQSGDFSSAGKVTGQAGVAIGSGAISAKTSGYTLTASDNGKVITFNSASALVCGIGTASGATGFSCTVIQLGTGGVRFAASGVTLNSFNGLTLAGQHASASVVCYQTNVLNVSGNLIG